MNPLEVNEKCLLLSMCCPDSAVVSRSIGTGLVKCFWKNVRWHEVLFCAASLSCGNEGLSCAASGEVEASASDCLSPTFSGDAISAAAQSDAKE